MVGIIVLGAYALVVWLICLGYKLPRKYIKNKKLGIIFGFIGCLTIFSIFFGDLVYKYFQFRHVCETQAIYKIYDQEKYEKFRVLEKGKKMFHIKGEELTDLMKELGIDDYSGYITINRESSFLQFSVKHNKGNDSFWQKLVNIDTKELVYETRDYRGYGGWLCRLSDVINDSPGSSCPLGSCRSHRLGQFKKI